MTRETAMFKIMGFGRKNELSHSLKVVGQLWKEKETPQYPIYRHVSSLPQEGYFFSEDLT
jgi:hypothetical protein